MPIDDGNTFFSGENELRVDSNRDLAGQVFHVQSRKNNFQDGPQQSFNGAENPPDDDDDNDDPGGSYSSYYGSAVSKKDKQRHKGQQQPFENKKHQGSAVPAFRMGHTRGPLLAGRMPHLQSQGTLANGNENLQPTSGDKEKHRTKKRKKRFQVENGRKNEEIPQNHNDQPTHNPNNNNNNNKAQATGGDEAVSNDNFPKQIPVEKRTKFQRQTIPSNGKDQEEMEMQALNKMLEDEYYGKKPRAFPGYTKELNDMTLFCIPTLPQAEIERRTKRRLREFSEGKKLNVLHAKRKRLSSIEENEQGQSNDENDDDDDDNDNYNDNVINNGNFKKGGNNYTTIDSSRLNENLNRRNGTFDVGSMNTTAAAINTETVCLVCRYKMPSNVISDENKSIYENICNLNRMVGEMNIYEIPYCQERSYLNCIYYPERANGKNPPLLTEVHFRHHLLTCDLNPAVNVVKNMESIGTLKSELESNQMYMEVVDAQGSRTGERIIDRGAVAMFFQCVSWECRLNTMLLRVQQQQDAKKSRKSSVEELRKVHQSNNSQRLKVKSDDYAEDVEMYGNKKTGLFLGF